MNYRIKRLRILSASLFALLVIMVVWNIALRNNNLLLIEQKNTLETCLNSTLIAYEDLNNSIASGLCLPKLKGFENVK